MNTRKKLTATLTFVTIAAFSAAALAANGETPLGNCYNMVISSCNSTSNHPIPCAENGMDQCDEQYGNQATTAPGNKLRAPNVRPSAALLLPAVQSAREAARR